MVKKKLAALLSAVLIATSVMPSYVMADSPTYTDAEEAYEDDPVIVMPMIYRTEDDYVVVNPSQTYVGGAQTYATGQTPADTGLYETQFTGRAAELYAALKKANISETSPSATCRITASNSDEIQSIYNEAVDCFSTVMWAFQRDYPEKFLWTVNEVGLGASYSSTWIEITLQYTVEDAFTPELGSSAKAKINSVVSGCNASNRYGKLKYYHDWLVNNSRYGYATGSDNAATAYYQHSAIGCLVKGGGVCESYAKSFKIFCARENIPCTIITGSNHAWNYVKMEDGNWYMVDCTFDDPVGSGDVLRYNYFLVSNNPEDSDHRNDGELLYPKTSTKAYDSNTSHTHSYGAYVVTKEATCAETGVETATCSCGEKITRTIAKTNNHSWDNGVVTKQPTETAEGVRTYTCSVCKQTKTESIPKLAHTHSYGAYVVTRAATCAETGVETATCSCGDKITRTIAKDASNHVGGTEVRNAKEATCAAEGYTGDTYCKGCSAKLSSGKSIAKTNNHSWDNGVVTKQPTETAEGVRTFTCSVCKQTKTESIPTLNHTHSYGAYVVTKAATCAETGVETATCSCGDKITRTIAKDASNHVGGTEVRNAKEATCAAEGYTGDTYCKGCGAKLSSGKSIAKTTNHAWDNGVVTKQPTETAEGVRTFTCSVCKQTKTESIPTLNHTHSYGAYVVTKAATCAETGVETATCSCGEKITRTIAKDASNHVDGTEVRNAKGATCAAEGYTGDTYCKGCEAKLSSGKSIAKTTNHAWDNGVVTKQPTETAEGTRTYTCSVCKQTKSELIPKLNPTHTHAYDEEVVVKEPTCAETGLKEFRCACGELGSEEVIPATGNHNFVDHVCTVCGKREMLPAPVIKSVTNGLKGVVVQWEAVEDADNYRIYRKKSGATSWSRVGDTTTLRFDDTTAESGTTYYYTVRPYDLETKSPTGDYNKTGKSVLFLKAGTPSSLSNTSTGITVKWAKITGAKGYYVYRKSGSDSYKRIAEVTSGSTVSYTDTSVKDKNGTAYTYTIRAYNGKTLGNYAGKSLTRLTGVTLSTLSNPSKGALKVTWKKQSKVTGYEIQYSTSSTFASGNKSVKVTSVSTLTKTIKSLKKGKTYYVRIRGYKTSGSRTDYSAWSGKKSLKLKK